MNKELDISSYSAQTFDQIWELPVLSFQLYCSVKFLVNSIGEQNKIKLILA